MTARVIWAGVILATLIALGTGYEQVQRRRDLERFPQMGRSVNVGGRSLNIFCSGAGSPAVVFESDALNPGYGWLAVQRQVAAFTRACWYDRAGYGWSEPAPAPHTCRNSARDLHALLHAAGVPPPYVLVGAGFGSFDVRVFHGLFPSEVAGVVLSDAIHEDELVRFPEEQGYASRVPLHLGFPPDLVLRVASTVGLMRLTLHRNGRQFAGKGFSAEEQRMLAGLRNQPKMRAAFLAEQGFSTGPDEARTAGGLGNLPFVVMASEKLLEDPAQAPRREAKLQLQEQLAHLSSRGRLVLVKDTGGSIQYEVPEAITAAVEEVVRSIRSMQTGGPRQR
jgi:Alpha/beta hydrolase family